MSQQPREHNAPWPFATMEEYDEHRAQVEGCYALLDKLHEQWMAAYAAVKVRA